MLRRSSRAAPSVASPQARHALVVVALALAVPLSGCLILPFASPPIGVTTGLAVPGGTVLKPRRAGPTPVAPELISVLHAGAYPFQLMEEFVERNYDLGAGALVEMVKPVDGLNFYHYGGYLEGSWTFLNEGIWRLQLTGMIELLFSDLAATDAVAVGVGGTAQVSAEIVSFISEPVEAAGGSGGFVGWMHGEIGIGLYLAFSARYFVDDTYYYGVAGIRVRLPASFGFMIVPLQP